tara:strand:- start:336 stop:530 length:195 start_codon:yes stop_codon:yes gene_type:complete
MRMQMAQVIYLKEEKGSQGLRLKLCDKSYLTSESKQHLADLQVQINNVDKLLRRNQWKTHAKNS